MSCISFGPLVLKEIDGISLCVCMSVCAFVFSPEDRWKPVCNWQWARMRSTDTSHRSPHCCRRNRCLWQHYKKQKYEQGNKERRQRKRKWERGKRTNREWKGERGKQNETYFKLVNLHLHLLKFGVGEIFLKKSLMLNKAAFIWLKYSKNCNTEKYNYTLKETALF